MDDLQRREITEAINAADDSLMHLQNARRALGGAGGWGLLDLFGGGFISGLLKHAKMDDAEREVQMAKASLARFSQELRDVQGYSAIHINGFLTFGDFVFDGFLMDAMVQAKISKAKRQCDDAIRQVEDIREKLVQMLRQG